MLMDACSGCVPYVICDLRCPGSDDAPSPRLHHRMLPQAGMRQGTQHARRGAVAGMGAAVLLADAVYNVPANVIVDSCRRALTAYDVLTSMVKAWVFGLIISAVRARP
jgi:hypothetical protein